MTAAPKQKDRRIGRDASGRIASVFVPTSESRRQSLATEMARTLGGQAAFNDGARALYATDASNYRQVPLGVVTPRNGADVEQAVALCRRADVPLLARGGGTSLAGETCNTAVVLDFSRHMNRVLSIDPDKRLAEVEPGCILDDLRDAAEKHHLTFGPDPATHDHNTLGGMIGNNSCGVHSVMAGRTSDNVESLDILTYDGLKLRVGRTGDDEFRAILAAGGRRAEIYRTLDAFRHQHARLIRRGFPKIPRRVSGYDSLDALLPENGFNVARALVGTEGTCVTVLRARLNLLPSPPARVLAILGFPDVFAAADAVPRVLEFAPIGLEGLDQMLVDFISKKHVHVEDLALLPDGHGWLVAEFGGDNTDQAAAAARKLIDAFAIDGIATALLDDASRQKQIWELRESALAATSHVPGEPESWPGWEDSAVPREALGEYLRQLTALFDKYGYRASIYGHFGDGLVHCRIPFDLRTEAGVAKWQRFLNEAADLVVHYGGSLSGEHGDGQARAALLEKMYGEELIGAFREFKAIWDPGGRMNPGKVVDPFPIDSNLRVGPEYRPAEVSVHFAYAEDGGSFAKATRRCVGVGSCRRTESDKSVMCPSYMVTREERYSTRGRARLLFEMLHGGAIRDGWRSDAVEQALDLCLACKACKSDCPVGVDMATYKAEFRAHYYAGRLRPLPAWSMGLIHVWAPLASRLPRLVNALTQTPGLADATKRLAGIAPQRRIPRFSNRSFTAWLQSRPMRRPREKKVLLWPDTFNNFFRAETAIAATRLLEELDYQVILPTGPVCCGRPLYDWGRLDAARKLWRRNFTALDHVMRAGIPIVGLEPACLSAFRDELPNLMTGDERAQWLCHNSFLLTEFLDREQIDIPPLGEGRAALVQLHCHHHAVLDAGAEQRILQKIGIKAETMKSGCCGMAGSFGLEKSKYDVSMAAAERVLLPTLRAAPPETLVLANGFSCREQIEQGSGRKTLHIAELLAQGLTGE